MRGLTTQERFILTCGEGNSPGTLRDCLELQKRGLIQTERDPDGRAYYSVLAAGQLALRLDTAARALMGVSHG